MSGTANHLSTDMLTDYWLHDTDSATTDEVDEHLMQCEPCGQALDDLIALGDGVRAALRSGAVSCVASAAFVRRLTSEGLRVREYRLAHNGSVNCTIAPDDALLVAHLEAPLENVERLDAVVQFSVEPDVQHRLEDVPFDPKSGRVLWLPRIDRVRQLPAHTAEVTLLSVQSGDMREVGRYTFRHRPWPGW